MQPQLVKYNVITRVQPSPLSESVGNITRFPMLELNQGIMTSGCFVVAVRAKPVYDYGLVICGFIFRCRNGVTRGGVRKERKTKQKGKEKKMSEEARKKGEVEM